MKNKYDNDIASLAMIYIAISQITDIAIKIWLQVINDSYHFSSQ